MDSVTIDTPRLSLRHWQVNDAEALFKYASDSRVSRMALWPTHTSVEMSREVIEQIFIPNTESFAIVLKETYEPIGCIGLVPNGLEHLSSTMSGREIGYWIGYKYWGMGLVTEALTALIKYCRDTLHIDSLLITTDSRNIGSQRVAEKCGFKYDRDFMLDGIESKAFSLTLRTDMTI